MRSQLGIIIVLQLGFASLGWAQEAAATATRCSSLNTGNSRFSAAIGIVPARNLPRGVVDRAIATWASCPGYGTDFPPFVRGTEATQTVEVRFAMRGAGPRCGSFVGRTIVLYAFSRDENGRLRSCGSRADGLAHELGHVLGLRDAPDTEACRDHAMSWIDTSDRNRRHVDPEECRLVAERWLTPAEVGPDAEPVVVAGID